MMLDLEASATTAVLDPEPWSENAVETRPETPAHRAIGAKDDDLDEDESYFLDDDEEDDDDFVDDDGEDADFIDDGLDDEGDGDDDGGDDDDL